MRRDLKGSLEFGVTLFWLSISEKQVTLKHSNYFAHESVGWPGSMEDWSYSGFLMGCNWVHLKSFFIHAFGIWPGNVVVTGWWIFWLCGLSMWLLWAAWPLMWNLKELARILYQEKLAGSTWLFLIYPQCYYLASFLLFCSSWHSQRHTEV